MSGEQVQDDRELRPPARWRFLILAMFLLLAALSGCRAGGEPIVTRILCGPEASGLHMVAGSAGSANAPTDLQAAPPAPEAVLDLETAFQLAGVDNPTIALAQEAVRASEAQQLQARALLLPSLHAGTDFNLHRGNLQASSGIIRDVNRQSLYVGGGAESVGAGTVTVPAVLVFAQLADAVYEPRATGQLVTARRFDAQAVQNTTLLQVATRYFALLGAEESLRAIRQSESELEEVVRLTANFAKTGQGRTGDAERAQSEALLLHAAEERSEEEVAVAAAELARLLSADPSVRLRGPDSPIPLVELVDPRQPLNELIAIARRNRPEMGARTAALAANLTRLREERLRPLLPSVTVGFSSGEFGGGSNLADSSFGHFNGRMDFDVSAIWSLEDFGLGNLARQRRRRAEVNEAEADRLRVVNLIRREVAEAHALSAARRRQLDISRGQLQTAQEGYQLDLLRAKNLQALPIEVLNSVNLLTAARQEFIQSLVEYDQAQFQLFVALGQPPMQLDVGRGGCLYPCPGLPGP
jgi:outer membrane protein TolC